MPATDSASVTASDVDSDGAVVTADSMCRALRTGSRYFST